MEVIKIDNLSRLKINVYSIEDFKVLLFDVAGTYKTGSEGNNDGLFIFSSIATHYFIYEPITIILNLSNLNYEWGNTILKSINFFSEIGRDAEEKMKRLILILPNNKGDKLFDLVKLVESNNLIVSNNNEEAISEARKIVEDYLR